VVIVLVVMWVLPTAVAAVMAFNTWRRWIGHGEPGPQGGDFWEAAGFTFAALLCAAIMLGAWRMRRGAWWVMLVLIAGGLATALGGAVWATVRLIAYDSDDDEMVRSWEVVTLVFSLGLAAVLTIGLIVLLSSACRRVFLVQQEHVSA
jgi:hypothetical protein